jgi:molecular chaperone GrpE
MSDKTTKDWQKIKEASQHDDVADMQNAVDDTTPSLEEETIALDHPSYQALEDKLTAAEQKAHDHWEKLVRAMAEVDNIRRRAERDVSNAHRYALEKFVHNLLPVADSLEHAMVLAEKLPDPAFYEGLQLTMKLLLDALEKADVRCVDPTGLAFDPQAHEAMSMQVSSDVAPNTVLTVFQKGYLLNDRVIRPARVIVSKEKT